MSVKFLIPVEHECDACRTKVLGTAACEENEKGKIVVPFNEPAVPTGWVRSCGELWCPGCQKLYGVRAP